MISFVRLEEIEKRLEELLARWLKGGPGSGPAMGNQNARKHPLGAAPPKKPPAKKKTEEDYCNDIAFEIKASLPPASAKKNGKPWTASEVAAWYFFMARYVLAMIYQTPRPPRPFWMHEDHRPIVPVNSRLGKIINYQGDKLKKKPRADVDKWIHDALAR